MIYLFFIDFRSNRLRNRLKNNNHNRLITFIFQIFSNRFIDNGIRIKFELFFWQSKIELVSNYLKNLTNYY
jgi:hypothetical protein